MHPGAGALAEAPPRPERGPGALSWGEGRAPAASERRVTWGLRDPSARPAVSLGPPGVRGPVRTREARARRLPSGRSDAVR